MTTEEKAKAYDKAIIKAKELYNQGLINPPLEHIFPELSEFEDEQHRKWILEYLYDGLRKSDEQFKDQFKSAIAWLEKQKSVGEIVSRCKDSWYNEGKIQGQIEGLSDEEKYQQGWHDALEKQGEKCFVNFDEAEKEKYDFVSGQYIECRASFNEFKEGNSYWLEYVGDDTYIGRSDNILNQKFHITPRQLYRLFTQQHFYKEDNTNDETNAPTEYGKYVDECLNEASKHFFSNGEDAYSVADLFYAGVRCGKSWLEKQRDKPLFTFDDILALQCCMETVKKVQEDKELYEQLQSLHYRLHDAYWLEKQGEQKPVDVEEPLTEFERAFQGMCSEKNKPFAKDCCKVLLELAREQINDKTIVDAFIDKACAYISCHQCEYIDFEDFRKAMKGE